jgi:uncharacterized protein with HEPN domain
MKRNMRLYINDIWESILAIEEYTRSISEDEFYKDRQVQDAVIRRLEIIGEAVKNIDDDFRNNYTDIPWKKIAGMRDIIAHEYFGIKLERIWDAATKDLPKLKKKFYRIIKT